MPNLIAERDIVPELVQNNFTPEQVCAEIRRLLADGEARSDMIAGFEEIRRRLRASDSGDASTRAASAVLAALGQTS
jgi:lipid-A-disaccharide synthase